MLKYLKDRRQSEEGFTLIELMVVVLIMGILMAIAIPTFLATQGSAHDAAAKSNATNAFTNEKAYFEDNQVFTTGAAALDGNLPWGTASGDVSAQAGTATTGSSGTFTVAGADNALLVEGLSKSGDCFYIYDNESVTNTPVIAYAETSGGCVADTALDLPASTPTGSTNAGSSVAATISAWYTSW